MSRSAYHVRFAHPAVGDFVVPVPPEGLLIGRKIDDADVQLNWDTRVSRRHARIWATGDQVWFEDLGSTNGSWMGEERIEGTITLPVGTAVRVGETAVRLAVAGDPKAGRLRMEARAPTMREGGVATVHPRDSEHLAALVQVAERLLQSPGIEDFAQALRGIRSVVPGAQRISLVEWPPEPDGTLRHLVPPEALQDEGVSGGPISASLANRAVSTRRALYFSRDEQDVSDATSIARYGIHSALYVPLFSPDDEVLGLLCVDTPEPSVPFGEQDFHFVRAVGALIGGALSTERLRQHALAQELTAGELRARRQALLDFLKIAAHELKDPLAVVQMAADTMEGLEDPGLRSEIAVEIREAVRRARGLIDTYVSATAVEGGHLKLQLQPLDLRDVAEAELRYASRGLDDQTRQRFRFLNEVSCGPVMADPRKIRQVLGNLISNAVKYSPEGGEIRVYSEERDGRRWIAVADQGRGIAPEEQGRLFHQFERLGDPDLVPGTGLGLWLANAIVEAHGGRMGVESAEGTGSTFWFSLPEA